ncbi:hypothetical protein [Nocardioides sp.]|uniref:hypothetical protein n=1 Tax=Nocardioides sp. TaxID=35761 RepID=UPI003513E04C
MTGSPPPPGGRGLRTAAASLVSRIRFRRIGGSSAYWEARYAAGGASGAGSVGDLAAFKAAHLDRIVAEHGIGSVIEFGCGDGDQLALASYPRYLGLDVSPTVIERCLARFAGDPTRSFAVLDPARFHDPAGFLRAELTLSLDVLYHLVEDDVRDRHLRQLFGAATRFVAIYSSDEELPDPAAHVRHRPFSPWVAAHAPQWRLVERIANPHRGHDPAAVADLHLFARVG